MRFILLLLLSSSLSYAEEKYVFVYIDINEQIELNDYYQESINNLISTNPYSNYIFYFTNDTTPIIIKKQIGFEVLDSILKIVKPQGDDNEIRRINNFLNKENIISEDFEIENEIEFCFIFTIHDTDIKKADEQIIDKILFSNRIVSHQIPSNNCRIRIYLNDEKEIKRKEKRNKEIDRLNAKYNCNNCVT